MSSSHLYTPNNINQTQQQLSFWLKRWHNNPLAYVIECIGDTPTHQQATILKAFQQHRFVAAVSGHGIGKSRLMGWLINWWLDTHGKVCPITAGSKTQLYDITWKEVLEVFNKKWIWLQKQYKYDSEELYNKHYKTSWKAVLRATRMDNDDALQGFHDAMFFIDEGSAVRDKVFEVAEGSFGDPGAYGFMTGNPTKTHGYMFKTHNKRKSMWHCLHFSSTDSRAEKQYSYEYIDPLGNIKIITTYGRQTTQWIQNMKEEHGEHSNTFKIRVLGKFATINFDSIIDEKYLENVLTNKIFDFSSTKNAKRILGVDPAWTGTDKTAIVIRQDNKVIFADSWQGDDTVISTERIIQICLEYECDIINIDAIGIGAGIHDSLKYSIPLKNKKIQINKIIVSENAPDEKYKCKILRDYLWWQARLFIRKYKIEFYDGIKNEEFKNLKEELSMPGYKINEKGQICVETKKDMLKRGIKSPNLADAFNCTLYNQNIQDNQNQNRINTLYTKKKKKNNNNNYKTV